ncbi:MAG: hypothetical protein RR416_01805 [Clostridia bacterium]
MEINPTFREVKTDCEKRLAYKQIVMQCNLDTSAKNGVSRVCFVTSDVIITKAQTLSKQAKVSGKATIKAVYFDIEGTLRSFDYISDFVEDVEDDDIVANAPMRVMAKIVDSDSQVTESQIKIQLVIELTPIMIESITNEYLTDIDNALRLDSVVTNQQFVEYLDQEIDVTEEFDSGVKIDDVLYCNCRPVIENIVTKDKSATFNGIVDIDLIYTAGNGTYTKELSTPFVYETPMQDGKLAVEGYVCPKNCKIVLQGTEKSNVICLDMTLALSGVVMEQEEIAVIVDAYCPTKQLKSETKQFEMNKIVCATVLEETISGLAEIDDKLNVENILSTNVYQNTNANITVGDSECVCEGLVEVCVIFEDDNAIKRSVQIELPYSLKFENEKITPSRKVYAESICNNINAKLKKRNQIEIVMNVIFSCYVEEEVCQELISSLEQGEDIQTNTNSITIYLTQKGQSKWDIAKELAMPIVDIEEQNNDLPEIMSGEERLIVYRELKM